MVVVGVVMTPVIADGVGSPHSHILFWTGSLFGVGPNHPDTVTPALERLKDPGVGAKVSILHGAMQVPHSVFTKGRASKTTLISARLSFRRANVSTPSCLMLHDIHDTRKPGSRSCCSTCEKLIAHPLGVLENLPSMRWLLCTLASFATPPGHVAMWEKATSRSPDPQGSSTLIGHALLHG